MFLSCDKPSRRIIDNKTSMTKEERIQKRWDNRIDSVSYAIGLDVAMRLDQQFDRFDYERINKAITTLKLNWSFQIKKGWQLLNFTMMY